MIDNGGQPKKTFSSADKENDGSINIDDASMIRFLNIVENKSAQE